MAFIAALLFLALLGCGVVLAAAGYYYLRVLRPQLDTGPESARPKQKKAEPPAPKASEASGSLATFVEQVQELARLREQGILTSREFAAKKSELLERI